MDPVALEKQFHESLERASAVEAETVAAEERMQAGLPYLAASCPRCHTPFALAGEGKHLCRKCLKWLKVEKAK